MNDASGATYAAPLPASTAAPGRPTPDRLDLRVFPVRDVLLGEEARWADGVLSVDVAALAEQLVSEAGLRRVAITVARPGESVRIVNILDAVEPRCKPDGGQSFPGFLGTLDATVGRGQSNALEGMAVLVCGDVPGTVDSQVVSEAMVDMSGPGAAYTPFSRTVNLVIHCDFYDEQGPLKRTSVSRMAALMAARLVARPTIGRDDPAEVRSYDLAPPRGDGERPRLVYICPGMKLSALHETFLAGTPLTTTPTVVPASQLLDGILVSGNYDIGATRNPTFMYQRSPVVEDLLTRQTAGEIELAGVVVSQCLIEGYNGKQRSAHLAAEAAKLLGADGAVISIEECGHAYADLMLTCQACEELGVRTVLLMAESSGADGRQAAALAFAEAADAVVSVGNMDETVALPAVERAVGGTWFRGRWLIERMVSESLETPLLNIFAATCQMGPSALRAEEH